MALATVVERLTAYNLSVAGDETFFVAANDTAEPVWTRNCRSRGIGDNSDPLVDPPRSDALRNRLPDGQHGFNNMVEQFAGDVLRFTIDTRGPRSVVVRRSELFQITGSNNGVASVYEWVLDGGVITHRRFISGGTITGLPNQRR